MYLSQDVKAKGKTMIYATGIARIQHAETGEVYPIFGDSLDFEEIGSDERNMGPEIQYTVTLDHSELGELIWTVWEYPVGTINYTDYNINSHKLIEDFNFKLKDNEDITNTINTMVSWFRENFEDPQNDLPYNKEFGYLYLHGGPFEASDTLQEKFPDEPYHLIEAAVKKIQFDGTIEWAPIAGSEYYNDDDYQDDEPAINDNINDIAVELNTLVDSAPETKTAPAFVFGDDNQLHIAPPPDNKPVDSQNDSFRKLHKAIDDLLKSLTGANAHRELIPIIEEYKEIISGDKISMSELHWGGIRLDNATQIIKRGIEAKEQPSLPFNTELNLETAIKLHGTYIMLDETGKKLVNAATDYRHPPEQTEELKKASKQLADIIVKNRNLLGKDARELVHDVLMDIAQGQHPERSNQSAGNTLTNMLSGILKGVGSDSIKVFFSAALATSAPVQTMSILGTEAINAIWLSLTTIAPFLLIIVAPLAGELSWLASATHILERIRLATTIKENKKTIIKKSTKSSKKMVSKKEIDVAWKKAKPIRGLNPDVYRKDSEGNKIRRASYGKKSNLGWEIDHIYPAAKGGKNTPPKKH